VTYYLGIDVGAARTSAAITRTDSDDVEPVDLGDGGCGVASVLHLGADGSLDVGEAAERFADDEPDRVVRGFPGRIGDDVAMLLAGEPWAPEELTAWLVRWVVDRVAEREGGPAEAVAVTRPATWDADRTALLAGALAEQDLDATFLTTARATERHPDGPADVASAAACGAALSLRAGEDGADDVAARLAALARLPGRADDDGDRAADAPDAGPPAEVPAPRNHGSGGWAAADRPETTPVDGSGAHRSADTDDGHDALLAALGGFTGTLGATNTAGLLSGFTPPSGLPASGQATAVATDSAQVALPAQRSGSGRWAAVPDLADAEELEPVATPARVEERSPAALVSVGGAVAGLAVVATLFLWPAPRTTNSAVSRPAPLVPALTSLAAPTVEPTLTPTPAPTTTRPRPATARTRRPAAPPPAPETTAVPIEPSEPTTPTTTSEASPSESSAAPTTTTEERDDDD
jgi:hypothetical protein